MMFQALELIGIFVVHTSIIAFVCDLHDKIKQTRSIEKSVELSKNYYFSWLGNLSARKKTLRDIVVKEITQDKQKRRRFVCWSGVLGLIALYPFVFYWLIVVFLEVAEKS